MKGASCHSDPHWTCSWWVSRYSRSDRVTRAILSPPLCGTRNGFLCQLPVCPWIESVGGVGLNWTVVNSDHAGVLRDHCLAVISFQPLNCIGATLSCLVLGLF